MMPLQFPSIIQRKIDRLERTLRFYTLLDGLTATIFALILFFAASFTLDRFFEFPQIVRSVILPILLGSFLYILWNRILRRYFAPIRSDQLASVLERFVPDLNESLITAVEWQTNEKTDPDLMQQTIHEAAKALRSVNVRKFFRTGRLFLLFTLCLTCAILTITFCIFHSETTTLWFSRNILLSQAEYPRRSQLLVDGFQNGRIRIGRGDSFTLSVRANTAMPLIPESIRLRFGTSETGYRTIAINEFRIENQDNTDWRVFSTTFPEMLETVFLQIRGADSTLTGFCIEVVPTPTLTETTLKQLFPDYMKRTERTVSLTGRTTIPDGTGVTITAQSTKPLCDAEAVINQTESRSLKPETAETFDAVTLTLPTLRQETMIDFQLTDTDSLHNRQPIRADLGIVRDQPPVVTARLDGIGPAITPEAELPMVGEITDDNGLASATYRFVTESGKEEGQTETTAAQSKEGTVPITGIGSMQTIFPLEQTFSVSPLSVKVGDKLILSVEASDLFNLDSEQGQVGIGPRWSLEIVSPERLKNLLETREIALRQRFEVVIGEVERTKTILTDYLLEPLKQQVQEAAALTVTVPEGTDETETQRLQTELEAKKKNIIDTINSEQSELGKYHVSRMLRDTQKEVYDLLGIAESFRGIRQEMLNNKILTEEERRRIDQEIMQPIQGLINTDFPDTDQLLDVFNKMLMVHNEPIRPLALEHRQKIIERFDAVIQKMMEIRNNMASMESFNEAIELLRSIIKQQQQLRNETIEEKNKRLKDLLDN